MIQISAFKKYPLWNLVFLLKNNYIICTMEDEFLDKDETDEEDDLDIKSPRDIKKGKEEEETVDIDDLAEEEDVDTDLYDDVDPM